MTGISLFEAQQIVWSDVFEATQLQQLVDESPPLDRLPMLATMAKIRKANIFERSRPLLVMDSSILSLENACKVMEELLRALDVNNPAKVKAVFARLPHSLQSTLKWAIWFHDLLENKPIRGHDHGSDVFNENPLILSSYFLPILHISGGSLASQLFQYEREFLVMKYQHLAASSFFSSHQDQKQLKRMQVAIELGKYEQYRVLSSLCKTPKQKEALQSRVSLQVLTWAHPKGIIKKQPSFRSLEHLYDRRGAQYFEGSTSFCLTAPAARHVQCVLQGWPEHVIDMEKKADGTWQLITDRAPPGTTYRYRIHTQHGAVYDKVDPFSFASAGAFMSDRICSIVVDRYDFTWTDGEWCQRRRESNPLQNPLSIYELHIKSWDRDGEKNLRSLAPKLARYCKEMGFTHVELYGIMQHFWPRAVSYQVTNYFSPHHQSGTYQDMKFFVNYMHLEGIGVIVDWIPCHFDHGPHTHEHFCSSLHFLDGTDLFSYGDSMWGTLYFDYAKTHTRELLEASALWWLKEFHVDGLRVDAVSQIIRRGDRENHPGVEFLRSLNEKIHTSLPGTLLIAEATDWDPRLWAPTKSGGIGFDLNWSCGAAGDMRNYLQTPSSERHHEQHHQGKLEKVFSEGRRPHEKKIFTHSHDDTDSGDSHDKSLFYIADARSNNERAKFSDVRNFLSYQIFGPNWGHMIHMGDELAQKQTWSSRFNRGMSSVHWECLSDPAHRGIQQFVKDAIHYYKAKQDFWQNGGEHAHLFYSYSLNKIMAYTRGSQLIVHNFSAQDFPSYDIDLPSDFKEARFEERVNSDDKRYGGSNMYLNRIPSLLHAKGAEGRTLSLSLASRASVILERV